MESNHPPSIINQLPKSTKIRLSQLSANEEIFKNSIKPCKEALTKAGYIHEMRYQQNISHHQKLEEKYNMVQSTIQCKFCHKS